MKNEDLSQLIQAELQATAEVTGDGYHFNAVIISNRFSGLSSVKRQQLVYAAIGPFIQSGELHAITLQTYTQTEWDQRNG